MSFGLDRYEPVAFHTHPDLMRAAEAQTAVLHPAGPPPMASAPPVGAVTPVSPQTPAPAARPPTAPGHSAARGPQPRSLPRRPSRSPRT